MGNACISPVTEDSRTFQTRLALQNKNLPQASDINVLSYNIFVRPPMINNNGDDYKDERLLEFLKASKDFDIVCLQEMFGAWSDRKQEFIEKAKKVGFLYHAAPEKPPTLSHLFIDGGLLILSRYPIEAVEFTPYPYGIGADYMVQKGALYAKVKIGNAKLHLYTTHAQATYDTTLKYFLKRTEQFEIFQKFIRETLVNNNYTDKDMVLLTGDFNVNGRDHQQFQSSNPELIEMSKKITNLTHQGAFNEYDALVGCLTNNAEDELEDLLYNNHGEHPITFGDYYLGPNNEKKPREAVLTDKTCLCVAESLDYIFQYVPKGLINSGPLSPGYKSAVKQSLIVKEDSAAVERFLVHGHRFEQLSDHYGVKVTLQYKQQNEADLSDAETASATPYLQGYSSAKAGSMV